MKKYLSLLAAAMLLAACQSDDSVTQEQGPAIAFGVAEQGVAALTEVTTRTAPNTITLNGGAPNEIGLKNPDVGFGVFGMYTGMLNYEMTTVKPDFMYNQKVTWNGTDAWAWVYTPVKYWPNNQGEKISFFAYAPYEANPDGSKCIADFTAADELGDPKLVYKLATQPWGTYTFNSEQKMESTNPQQVDLLYGVKKGGEWPIYNVTKPTIATNLQEFEFQHALVNVGDKVTLQLSTAFSTYIEGYAKIYVKSAKIVYKNLTAKARLNLNSPKKAPKWTAIVSGDVTTTRTLNIAINKEAFKAADDGLTKTEYQTWYNTHAGVTNAANVIADNSGIFLIPLDVAGAQLADFTVDYQIINNAGDKFDGTMTRTFSISDLLDGGAKIFEGGNAINIAGEIGKGTDLLHPTFDITDEVAEEPSYSRLTK